MLNWLAKLFGRTDYRQRLLQLAQGNEMRVERLIAFELKRNPTLSREQATRNAAERLTYERSR
jgi:hypothetical protein